MRAVLQRVKQAKVEVDTKTVGEIQRGFLIFLGVAKGDTTDDADFLSQKISQLRIFEDPQGKMNLSLADLDASVLVVSQFTLYGDCRKGRRPSFDQAAPPEQAERLYEYFVECFRGFGITTQTGVFRAMMKVSLTNDGPVTFMLES